MSFSQNPSVTASPRQLPFQGRPFASPERGGGPPKAVEGFLRVFFLQMLEKPIDKTSLYQV